jgi:hypothetical protein
LRERASGAMRYVSLIDTPKDGETEKETEKETETEHAIESTGTHLHGRVEELEHCRLL